MNTSIHTWLVICNPAASNQGAGQRLPQILAQLKKSSISFSLVKTTKRGHASDLVMEGLKKGYRKIIGIGGDGTNNEIINGIFKQNMVKTTDITYSLLPLGTGNDWIKTHRIPKKISSWVKMIEAGKTTCQDVGIISYCSDKKNLQHFFVNVAGMAYDAFLVKMGDQLSSSGSLHYLSLIFKGIFKYKPQKARICFEGQVIEDTFYTIHIGIGRYSGGGMCFVPHAIPDDGMLALTLVRKVSKAEVFLYAPLFYSGKLNIHPKISLHKAKNIRIEAISSPLLVEADGEFLGQTPVEFSVLEKALRIIVP